MCFQEFPPILLQLQTKGANQIGRGILQPGPQELGTACISVLQVMAHTATCIITMGQYASCRRDKYQRHIKEYWIERCTRGNYSKAEEEAWMENVSAEGHPGDGVDVGGIHADDPLGGAADDAESTEPEESEEPTGKGGKGGKGRSSRSRRSNASKQTRKDDLEEEAALEACHPCILHCEIRLPQSLRTRMLLPISPCSVLPCRPWRT